MADVPAVRRLPVVADLTLVTAGAMTANVAGYLLQLLAGRWLGIAGYSEFASLLAVQLLCAVPALALQNVVARELVHGASPAALRGLGLRCALIVAAVAAVLVPLVTVVLDVGPAACAAALAAAPALVVLSGEQGVLQGGRRFRGLAIVLGTAGVARVAPALAVLALGGGAAPALWAAAAGIAGAALVARWVAGSSTELTSGIRGFAACIDSGAPEDAAAGTACAGEHPDIGVPSDADGPRRDDIGGESGPEMFDPSPAGGVAGLSPDPAHTVVPGDPGGTGELRRTEIGAGFSGVFAVLLAAQVQAALMALSSADLIVVRIVLDEADASRYALGTIAAKIAFWLPQAVGVVLYPRMAQPASSAGAIRSALGVLSGIGVLAVAGAAVAAPLAPLFAGQDYAPIQGLLWLFALHGAVLAVLQGALLSAIAVDRTALAWLAWTGLFVEVTLMLTVARSIPSLIGTAASVAAVTTLLVAAIVVRAAAVTRQKTITGLPG